MLRQLFIYLLIKQSIMKRFNRVFTVVLIIMFIACIGASWYQADYLYNIEGAWVFITMAFACLINAKIISKA